MLPGLAPTGMFGGLSRVFVASSTSSTAATIAWPAGLRRGDIAVLFDLHSNASSNAPAKVVPTGFTEIIAGLSSFTRLVVSYKVLDGTESGNITGGSALQNIRKRLYILRGDADIRVISTMSPPNLEMGAAAPANQTVPAHSGDVTTFVFGFAGGNDSSDVAAFSTETPAYGAKELVGTNALVGYTIYNGPSSSQICGKGDTGLNVLSSFYMSFS